MEKATVHVLQKAVLTWYKTHGRHDLPWRNLTKLGLDVPYGVMVSEFMLQQTQVERVIPKFRAFVHYFPTIQKLANATPAMVITLWSGLGYNRRAIMLHQAAQEIVRQYSGVVPQDQPSLEALSGIGPYTASAILAFGYNQQVAVLDTNIERFYELLFWGYDKPSLQERTSFVLDFVPTTRSCIWHSALMDLMSQVRSLKSPHVQQQALLEVLAIQPTWQLPKLSTAPLKRPKQSKFHRSPRYYRGRIVAFLRTQSDHKATFHQLTLLMEQQALPQDYSLVALLEGLHKDGLVLFRSPLKPRSIIRLP